MKGFVKWFEIPVEDLARATAFYSYVFRLQADLLTVHGNRFGMLSIESKGEKIYPGSLKETGKRNNGSGTILFFESIEGVDLTIEKAVEKGGTIIQPKRIVSQMEENGKILIPKNYIDGKLGYFALITDSEGNQLGIYGNH